MCTCGTGSQTLGSRHQQSKDREEDTPPVTLFLPVRPHLLKVPPPSESTVRWGGGVRNLQLMIFEEHLSKPQRGNKKLCGGSNFLFPSSSCSNPWFQRTEGKVFLWGVTWWACQASQATWSPSWRTGCVSSWQHKQNDQSEHAHSVPGKGR